MKIYTSYYRHVSDDMRNLIPVRISTSVPSWFPWVCDELPELYPGWDLVNGIKAGAIDWDEYTRIYKEHLSTLSRDAVLEKLKIMSQEQFNKDVVLLCYENKDKPCHRHLVAEWLDCGVEELV